MAYHHHPNTQRPIGPPKQHGRIELNVLKLDPDGNSIHDGEFDSSVCDCFPRTSKKTIPSMLYDRIKCPHHQDQQHIQPAQQAVFTYPWTASSEKDYRNRGRSDQLSVIGEEEDSEEIIHDVIRTAPPFATVQNVNRQRPPFTAPANNAANFLEYNNVGRRVMSQPSLTGYRGASRQQTQRHTEPVISTPYVDYTDPDLTSRVHGKQEPFMGQYVDPKNGQVYKFKVKLDKESLKGAGNKFDSRRPTPNVVG